MVYTIGDEFIEGYIRDAMSMPMGCEVKVWDPPSQDFRDGSVYSRDDDGMCIWLHYENIFLTVPNKEIFLVVREDEEDNEYIPLVTDVLAYMAKDQAIADAETDSEEEVDDESEAEGWVGLVSDPTYGQDLEFAVNIE